MSCRLDRGSGIRVDFEEECREEECLEKEKLCVIGVYGDFLRFNAIHATDQGLY
jgi:hypothetical protein